MAELGFDFDATQVEPQADFELLPAGEYPAMITESEWNTTKRGDGQYLKLRLDIIDGPAQGRCLFDNLNLQNPNPQAVEIAQKALSGICHAIGVLRPRDTMELHDKPLLIKVGIRPAKDGYEAQNNIKAYKPLETAAPAPAPQHQPQQQQNQQPAPSEYPQQQGQGNTPPWNNMG